MMLQNIYDVNDIVEVVSAMLALLERPLAVLVVFEVSWNKIKINEMRMRVYNDNN